MSPKEQYIRFCAKHELPLFFQPQWLNTCGLPWDVLIIEKKLIQAFWVFHIEKKLGFTFIRNQHLLPYSGLIFGEQNITIEQIQEFVNEFMKQLPATDVLSIDLSINIPLEIQFKNLITSTKITNIISLESKAQIFAGFQAALQRQIRKAEKNLHIVEIDDLDLFYSLHQKTFEKQNQKAKISIEVYRAYWQTCKIMKCGKLFFITDNQQNTHAALWMVWDHTTAYYLAGGTDHSFYGSGAMSKLMWHAIETAFDKKLKYFDFEGSMLPSVNTFFRKFGPIEKKYLHLEKINSTMYKIYKKLR